MVTYFFETRERVQVKEYTHKFAPIDKVYLIIYGGFEPSVDLRKQIVQSGL